MSTLARANGQAVSVGDALRRSMVHGDAFLDKVVELLLVRSYAESKGIRNTDQELQLAADELRYQRGLESVEKLQQWMKQNHQTLESLQEAIDGMLLRNKVRNSISDNEVAAYFAEHQMELEQVELYSIRVATEGQARELLASIQDEGANFHVLAMEHSQDEQSKLSAGYVGKLNRAEMTGEIEAAVFKAAPGQVLGPIKTDKGWNLFKVAAIHKPNLERDRESLRATIFNNLLAKWKAESKVEFPVLQQEMATHA